MTAPYDRPDPSGVSVAPKSAGPRDPVKEGAYKGRRTIKNVGKMHDETAKKRFRLNGNAETRSSSGGRAQKSKERAGQGFHHENSIHRSTGILSSEPKASQMCAKFDTDDTDWGFLLFISQ